jgi:tripartite-type tricarboxylate transporter receptor subunit TctC
MQRLFQPFVAVALACAVVTSMAVVARADDDYPNHAVRWLVGYPPGGSTDICARLIGQSRQCDQCHAL